MQEAAQCGDTCTRKNFANGLEWWCATGGGGGRSGGHRWATLLLSRETALPMYTCAFPIDSLIKYLQHEAAMRRQPSELRAAGARAEGKPARQHLVHTILK